MKRSTQERPVPDTRTIAIPGTRQKCSMPYEAVSHTKYKANSIIYLFFFNPAVRRRMYACMHSQKQTFSADRLMTKRVWSFFLALESARR